MIISANSDPLNLEFKRLIDSTLKELNICAVNSAKEITLLGGNKLEPFVKEIMEEQAKGTVFENSIELISGQKFPDIVARKYFGVEVKSTTQNHWKTTGNSVLESTRVEDVERIYMLFGKLGMPVEFKCRPYEDCLSDVVVTHSPRYLIDMDLPFGETIFDKMDLSYEVLRTKPNPIKPIVSYYRKKLKNGEDIWWLDQDNGKSNDLLIKIWNNLNPVEKNSIRVKAMAFFTEIFGNDKKNKFNRIPAWLVIHHSVVCKNVRDLFTAGGKENLSINGKLFKNVPRILVTLIENLREVVNVILTTPSIELSIYWSIKTTEKSKLNDWINLVTQEANKIDDAKHLNIREIISISLKY